MFVRISDPLRRRIAQQADRLLPLLPSREAEPLRLALEDMNREGGLEEARLIALQQMLHTQRQAEDPWQPEEEQEEQPDGEDEDKHQESGERTLTGLLMIRLHELLTHVRSSQTPQNTRMIRKR